MQNHKSLVGQTVLAAYCDNRSLFLYTDEGFLFQFYATKRDHDGEVFYSEKDKITILFHGLDYLLYKKVVDVHGYDMGCYTSPSATNYMSTSYLDIDTEVGPFCFSVALQGGDDQKFVLDLATECKIMSGEKAKNVLALLDEIEIIRDST